MYKHTLFKQKEVFYNVEGTGQQVVVLIHGFPENGTIFRNQISFLKKEYTLIAPDLPGSGRSPYNERLVTIEEFADSVNAILVHENVAKATMLGHSMGGYITVAFAERYPEKLNGFGFIHSHASAENEEKKENRLRSIKIMQENGGEALLRTMVPGLFTHNYQESHPEEINEIIDAALQQDCQALIRFYEIMMYRRDRTDVLEHSKVPVLFVLGEEDTLASVKNVLPQTHLPEVAVVKILSDTAHMSMVECPDELSKIIQDFLQYV